MSMTTRILEIGVAVRDLVTAGKKLIDILAARGGEVLMAEKYGMKAQMFRVGNIEFELMEALGQEGTMANFIKRRGEGLHHLAFEVDDIAETIRRMKNCGFKLIDEEPVSIEGCKAAFLHPSSFGGVLFELIEGTPRWIDDLPLPVELQSQSPAEGLGAEGILAVGILVDDLEAASRTYSIAFSSETSETLMLDQDRLKVRVCRIGNVDLVLMEIPEGELRSRISFAGQRLGLNHIVLKVGNLRQAVAFLNDRRVGFTTNHTALTGDSNFLFIEPRELSGIPILLKDAALSWPGIPSRLQA